MIKILQDTHSIIVISYTIGDLLPKLGGLQAAVTLHREFLQTVLRLPMAFHYVNPSGRLLSRFSKDINVVDQPLPRQLDSFAYFAIQVNFTTVHYANGEGFNFFGLNFNPENVLIN